MSQHKTIHVCIYIHYIRPARLKLPNSKLSALGGPCLPCSVAEVCSSAAIDTAGRKASQEVALPFGLYMINVH